MCSTRESESTARFMGQCLCGGKGVASAPRVPQGTVPFRAFENAARHGDLLLFRGDEPVSECIRCLQRTTLGRGAWSHTGLVVERDKLPAQFRETLTERVYVLESILSGPLGSGVYNAVSHESFFGTQLRSLRELQFAFEESDAVFAWAALTTGAAASVETGQDAFDEAVLDLIGRPYPVDPCSFASALCPKLRRCRACCNSLTCCCHEEDWLFCSEMCAEVYRRTGVLPASTVAADVLPMDFLGFDRDGIPCVVTSVMIVTGLPPEDDEPARVSQLRIEIPTIDSPGRGAPRDEWSTTDSTPPPAHPGEEACARAPPEGSSQAPPECAPQAPPEVSTQTPVPEGSAQPPPEAPDEGAVQPPPEAPDEGAVQPSPEAPAAGAVQPPPEVSSQAPPSTDDATTASAAASPVTTGATGVDARTPEASDSSDAEQRLSPVRGRGRTADPSVGGVDAPSAAVVPAHAEDAEPGQTEAAAQPTLPGASGGAADGSTAVEASWAADELFH